MRHGTVNSRAFAALVTLALCCEPSAPIGYDRECRPGSEYDGVVAGCQRGKCEGGALSSAKPKGALGAAALEPRRDQAS